MLTTADQYRSFASLEARGESPLYEALALGVAEDPDLLDLLSTLPAPKRQPNLLFAAARHLTGTPSGYADFRRSVLTHRDAIRTTMLARRTQTNEPARCAALYPLLASLPQPLALLEVGASAGLCLLPDRYAYTYSDGHRTGAPDSPLHLHCQVAGTPPPHLAKPGPITVAWRAGIDLNPLDVADPDDVQWLRTLVWPEQHDRLERLNTAVTLAQADPPHIVRGDLNTHLVGLAAQAPPDATLVVFHTAVLYYVPPPDRTTFVNQVRRLDAHWISQEAPPSDPLDTAAYVLSLNDHPLAVTALHGGHVRWLAAP